jgi:hypothetical protein
VPALPAAVDKPATRLEAARFLAQAPFGPVDADIDRLMDIGCAAWTDERLATTAPTGMHRARWQARDAERRLAVVANVGPLLRPTTKAQYGQATHPRAPRRPAAATTPAPTPSCSTRTR